MHLCLELIEKLKDIFNNFWNNNIIPDSWRKYSVIFIDKRNKEKVRPISLASCMCKTFERMVNYRLTWWIEKNNIIDKSQTGFMKGKGCLENLSKAVIQIKTNLHKNIPTLAAFLDVKSAYDNVIYDILINRLDKIRCPIRIRNFIATWMLYREVEFIIDNDNSETRIVNKGFPQGAVISPNLYSIYTASITDNLNKQTEILQFADDIAIYSSDKKEKTKKKYNYRY